MSKATLPAPIFDQAKKDFLVNANSNAIKTFQVKEEKCAT